MIEYNIEWPHYNSTPGTLVLFKDCPKHYAPLVRAHGVQLDVWPHCIFWEIIYG